MKTKLTRAQIRSVVKPGDVILVHYIEQDAISAGIQFATGGQASHALCCMGGLETVEADIGGVMHTLMDTYMTGKTRLTVKRLRQDLTHGEANRVRDYWLSCVSNPYDLGMIAHTALVFPIRRFLAPFLPRLARVLLRLVGALPLASHELSTCAELVVRGWRRPRPLFLRAYEPEDITPELLMRDAAGLEVVVQWERPVLAEEAR